MLLLQYISLYQASATPIH